MLQATTLDIRTIYPPQNIAGGMIQWMRNHTIKVGDKTVYVPAKTKCGTQRTMIKTFDIDLFIERLAASIENADTQRQKDRSTMLSRAKKVRESITLREAGSE